MAELLTKLAIWYQFSDLRGRSEPSRASYYNFRLREKLADAAGPHVPGKYT